MIQKLRRNFIIIAMGSIALVLGIILTIIVGVSYSKAYSYADRVLDVLVENNGSFKNYEFEDIPVIGGEGIKDFFGDKAITQETKFETRYISISYETGNPKVVEKAIMALSDDKAIEMANEAIQKNNNKGIIDNYRYRISESNSLVVFVDNGRNLLASRNVLKVCIVSYLSALLFVFILLVFLSKLFISPTVKTYEKQKSFITDAGHELKTPLTIISANNELIEMEFGETDSTKAINKQVEKMTTMVKNLTALATLDEGTKQSMFHIFSISASLNDAVDSFLPVFETNTRKLECDIEDNVDYNGNESLIKELFSILLDNANKYALTFTKITLKKNKNNIIITCENDASEVIDGNNDMCFERFYRSAESRKKSGSGIGLAIANQIIETHKGKIHAIGNSKDNTFKIEIVL